MVGIGVGRWGRGWVIALVVLGACFGGDDGSSSEGDPDAGTDPAMDAAAVSGGRDAGSAPAAECSLHRDCGGGRACVDGACVDAACQTSLDCAGRGDGLTICDDATGSCVECVRDADCGGDTPVCGPGICTVSCDSDKDCTARGMLCDLAAGSCTPPPSDSPPAAGMDAGPATGGSGGGDPAGGTGGGDPAGGTGGGDPTGGSGGEPAGGSGGGPALGDCGAVLFIVDGSGSMTETFGGPTRWEAVRAALVGSGGVIEALQQQIAFGLAIYTSNALLDPFCLGGVPLPGFPPCDAGATSCPDLVVDLPPALSAHATLDSAYPVATPGGQTPTAEALDALYPGVVGGTAVVLITDGAPNTCSNLADPVAAMVTSASAAAAGGVRTHVVGITSDATLIGQLDAVAQAGDTGTALIPADPDALRSDLIALVEGLCAP